MLVDLMKGLKILWISMFECMQNWEALFTAINISGWRCTQLGRSRPYSQHIITYLKSNTDSLTKASKALDCCLIACPNHGSQLGCTTHQSSGLAANHI